MSMRTSKWVRVGAILGAAIVLWSAAPAEAREREPRRVRAEDMGVDSSRANVPWRAEKLGDGSIRVVFGGIDNVPMDSTTTEYATDTPEGSAVSAAASWSCNMFQGQYTTVRDGSYLRGVAHVDCTGASSHRVNWQFMRSSWSGYRAYTNFAYGGWVSDVHNASTKYAYCGSGGTYDYKLRYWSDVNVGGTVYYGPYAENNTVRSTCGTGVS